MTLSGHVLKQALWLCHVFLAGRLLLLADVSDRLAMLFWDSCSHCTNGDRHMSKASLGWTPGKHIR